MVVYAAESKGLRVVITGSTKGDFDAQILGHISLRVQELMERGKSSLIVEAHLLKAGASTNIERSLYRCGKSFS